MYKNSKETCENGKKDSNCARKRFGTTLDNCKKDTLKRGAKFFSYTDGQCHIYKSCNKMRKASNKGDTYEYKAGK